MIKLDYSLQLTVVLDLDDKQNYQLIIAGIESVVSSEIELIHYLWGLMWWCGQLWVF